MPGERLRLRLGYRPDLFDRASVVAIAGRLVRLLEAADAAPDRAIGRLDILGPQERHTILEERTRARMRLRPGRWWSCLRFRFCGAAMRWRWCLRTRH